MKRAQNKSTKKPAPGFFAYVLTVFVCGTALIAGLLTFSRIQNNKTEQRLISELASGKSNIWERVILKVKERESSNTVRSFFIWREPLAPFPPPPIKISK